MDLRDVELRIAVAEGVLSRSEADALGEEARRKHQDPLALLAQRGRITQDSLQSFRAEALNAPELRAAGLDGEASTYTLDPPAAPASSDPAFPVPGWDRYTSVRFLGQGGMGMVFLALDTQLRREVAIKFVRGDDADHVRRLITEARTQARIKHDRVCNVYEVGEVEGKVYIAMQYIDGEPLGRLSGELTVEQKVMLIRGAAEGIHEAHRVGIIHRDIKPSNIMVEQSDDGEYRPYVMDFGLARSAQDASATLSGALLGTPRYMAPEQAQGDMAKLDRRADIYSLGATLYHLLTGQSPIAGEAVAEILHNLMIHDPRPPRTIDRTIPVDLEAIVVKCLERDRSARYDSARALADDLGRFMNGEPVLARRAGHWYRLRKRLAKHRGLVTAGTAALAMIAIAVGWGIKTRGEADEREHLARRFAEVVATIESQASFSALARRHDIRSDREVIRREMAGLATEIRHAGSVGAGPGHYALGRGHLALGDDANARLELDLAWSLGFHEPRVAYALAIVMGHLYRDNLVAAERIEGLNARKAKKLEIEHMYRDPALAYLRESRAAELPSAEVPSSEYVAALMAYYEGQFDDALVHLDSVHAPAWFYEASQLRGDILVARALRARDGGDASRAQIDFEAGRNAYSTAAVTGESVPEIYASLGHLEYAVMVAELYGGGDVTASADRALAAIASALSTDATHYGALVLRARILRSLAEHRANRSINVDSLLANALADIEQAAKVAADRPQVKTEMAAIYRQLGQAKAARGEDPGDAFRRVMETSDAIPPNDRDADYFGNLGAMFSVWADYEGEHGGDAEVHRARAITAFDQALHLNREMWSVWINLGVDWYKRASQSNVNRPKDDLERALDALEHARKLRPTRWVSYFYMGKVYGLRAQRDQRTGADPAADLALSLTAYSDGLAINPTVPQLHNGIGEVWIARARLAWERGENPSPVLDHARQTFEQAIAEAPEQSFGYGNLVEVFAQQAWYERERDTDPSASVRAADAVQIQAKPRDAQGDTWPGLVLIHAIQAAYNLDHGVDPKPSLDAAERANHGVAEQDSNSALVHRGLGELHAVRAALLGQPLSTRETERELAARELQSAIRIDPDSLESQLALGHLYRTWAIERSEDGSDPSSPLARGLALTRGLASPSGGSPDARLLLAGLLVVQAQKVSADDARAARINEAQSEARAALGINPALTRHWKACEHAARSLVSAVH